MVTDEQRKYVIQDLKARFKAAYGIELEQLDIPGRPYEAYPLVPVVDEITFVLDIVAVRSWHQPKDIRICFYQFNDHDYEIHPQHREWVFIMEINYNPGDPRQMSVSNDLIITSLVALMPLKEPQLEPAGSAPGPWEYPL